MQVVCFIKISLIYMTSYWNFLLRFGLVNITDFTKLHILHIFFKKNIVLTTLKKMIFALCSISLIKMSSYNITLGKNGPNLILLNINNVI